MGEMIRGMAPAIGAGTKRTRSGASGRVLAIVAKVQVRDSQSARGAVGPILEADGARAPYEVGARPSPAFDHRTGAA